MPGLLLVAGSLVLYSVPDEPRHADLDVPASRRSSWASATPACGGRSPRRRPATSRRGRRGRRGHLQHDPHDRLGARLGRDRRVHAEPARGEHPRRGRRRRRASAADSCPPSIAEPFSTAMSQAILLPGGGHAHRRRGRAVPAQARDDGDHRLAGRRRGRRRPSDRASAVLGCSRRSSPIAGRSRRYSQPPGLAPKQMNCAPRRPRRTPGSCARGAPHRLLGQRRIDRHGVRIACAVWQPLPPLQRSSTPLGSYARTPLHRAAVYAHRWSSRRRRRDAASPSGALTHPAAQRPAAPHDSRPVDESAQLAWRVTATTPREPAATSAPPCPLIGTSRRA